MTTLLRALALLFAFTLIAAACGDDDGGEAGGEGEIVISGSSTVEPISINVAESYREVEPDVNISVTGPGTGDGFKAFCAGETDISDASRRIKDEEVTDCEANGIDWVELKVGIDRDRRDDLRREQRRGVPLLRRPLRPRRPRVDRLHELSDANGIAGEVGNGGLHDAELVISAPGTESGTYDSFVEIVLEGIAEERGQEATTRPDDSSAADDNVIIETIKSNPTSFGWVGFAFADLADGVTLIPIAADAGGACIEPNPETIASNEYPISRDLFHLRQRRQGNGERGADRVRRLLHELRTRRGDGRRRLRAADRRRQGGDAGRLGRTLMR